jgi:hypothetical protein
LRSSPKKERDGRGYVASFSRYRRRRSGY